MTADAPATSDQQPPLLRVVRGNPTHDELAALVAVVAARRAGAAEDTSSAVPRSGWTDRSRALRGIHRPGPHGWRSAGLPR